MQTKAAVLKQVRAGIGQTHLDAARWPIDADFDGGTLRLAGTVPDVAAKKTILRTAAAAAGVERIDDCLRVGGGGSEGGNGDTRDTICKWLLQAVDFRNCAIHARVKGQRETLRETRHEAGGSDASGSIEVGVADGIVTLQGEVISLSHKRLAGVVAWWANGCRDVVNELSVVPQEDDSDDEVVDALRLVLESDPCVHADGIAVAARDHVVTLSGVVGSADEKARAEMDAWYLYAVDQVVNRIEVR
jgi:osmotically-inducible protein OsmY